MSLGPDVLKPISKTEIAKHDKSTDAWVTHNGYVYDITNFIKEGKHPGGNDMFEEYLGKDCKEGMDASDHSPFAYNLIKEFVIGTVAGEKQCEMFPVPSKQMRDYEVTQVRDTVTFSKPLLTQIFHAGDRYWPWIINRPVCQKFEIFDQAWLENNFTRWPWWYIWVVFPPISLLSLYWSLTSPVEECGASSVGHAAAGFGFGVFFWTLAEYFLHRFVFHMEVQSTSGNIFHFFMHGCHHLLPSDSSRLTFPPALSLALAVLFHNFFYFVTPSALFSCYSVFAGFVLGYLLYDTAHFFFHHTDFNNRLFRFCKKAHLGHHYKNEEMNFGVTSPLWDLVFGTYDPYNVSPDTKTK